MFLPPEEVREVTEIPVFVSERIILPFVNDSDAVRVTEAKNIEMLDDISLGDRFLGVVPRCFINRSSPHHGPLGLPFINATGCIAELTEYNRFKDDDATVKWRGLARFRIAEYLETGKSYPVAKIEFFSEENERYHDEARVREYTEEREPKIEAAMKRVCLAGQRVQTKILSSLDNTKREGILLNPPDAVSFSFLAPYLFSFDEDDLLHLLQSPCPLHRLEFIADQLEDFEKAVDENIERKEFLKPFQHIKNNPNSG